MTSDAPTTIAISIEDIERCMRQRVRFDAGRAKINAKRSASLATATAAVRRQPNVDMLADRPAHGQRCPHCSLRMKRATVSRILTGIMERAD